MSILLQVVDESVVSKTEQLMNVLSDRAIVLGEKIITVIIVYIIGMWIIKLLNKVAGKLLERNKIDVTVRKFVRNVIKYSLNIMLIIAMIGILGIQTTSFAAILGAAGLAIGLAMKDNLGNFAGGVMLLINKPFKVGDRIVAQGQDGTVKEIGILYTVLDMADGRVVFQPNGPLSTGSIVNYSTPASRRIDITFNVNYGNNAESLKAVLSDIIAANNKILTSPAPFVGVTAVNNGNFDITIRVWAANQDYGTVSVYLNEMAYKALSEKGIFTSSLLSVRMVN